MADQTESTPKQLKRIQIEIKYIYIKNIPFSRVVQKVFLNLIVPCLMYEQFNVLVRS